MALSPCRFLAPVREGYCSTLPTESCWGVPWSIAPLGKSTNVSWTWCCTPARGTTRRGFGSAQTPPTAEGLALLVTGRGPPEQASAWLGRWTGRLRRPRTVERLYPAAERN